MKLTVEEVREEALDWITEREHNVDGKFEKVDLEQLVGHIYAILKYNESEKTSN